MKHSKSLSALASLVFGALVAVAVVSLPTTAFAGEGEAKCSGEKKCSGETAKCSADKKAPTETKCSGEKKCSGETAKCSADKKKDDGHGHEEKKCSAGH